MIQEKLEQKHLDIGEQHIKKLHIMLIQVLKVSKEELKSVVTVRNILKAMDPKGE